MWVSYTVELVNGWLWDSGLASQFLEHYEDIVKLAGGCNRVDILGMMNIIN